MNGMTDAETQEFLERISATAIANQAILKTLVSGFPLTSESAIQFVGDFLDPEKPEFQSLIEKIGDAIDEVVECRVKTDRFLSGSR